MRGEERRRRLDAMVCVVRIGVMGWDTFVVRLVSRIGELLERRLAACGDVKIWLSIGIAGEGLSDTDKR